MEKMPKQGMDLMDTMMKAMNPKGGVMIPKMPSPPSSVMKKDKMMSPKKKSKA